MDLSSQQLSSHRSRLGRKNTRDVELEYLDRSVDGIDDKESARDFLQSIEDFTTRKAHEAANLRKRIGLPECLRKDEGRRGHQKHHSESFYRLS